MFSPRGSASRMPSSHDESLCPCCILVYFNQLISFLAVCIQICTLLRVAQLYGILHKATLSSENPTVEFSSEFKKVRNQHSGTNSTVLRSKCCFSHFCLKH
ncbi:unnamed protein product [Sphagnum jensenii]|uniref:Uncharacterized protein n=1 Tax=Sphagnum jensenii TaxID=128206 RepID=A0ABP0W6X6_9BRYO